MLNPDSVKDIFSSEVTNLSIVAGLFLTMTIPLFFGPPDAVMDGEGLQWIFFLAMGGAVAGQIATVVVSLTIITCLNKCVGDESGVFFIKSVFNPHNGITGLIGPALYIGAIFSWAVTLLSALIAAFALYSVEEGVIYMFIFGWVLFVFIMAEFYGILAEIQCSKPEMEKLNKYLKVGATKSWELRNALEDIKTSRVYTYDYGTMKQKVLVAKGEVED